MKRKFEEAVLPMVTKRAKGEDAEIKNREDYEKVWKRNELDFDPEEDLIFQQMDIDYTMVIIIQKPMISKKNKSSNFF